MRKLLFFLLAIIFFPSPQISKAAQVVLACNGVRHIKHYNEKDEISFLAEVDVANKVVVLKEPTTIFNYDMKTKTLTPKPKIEVTKLKIFDEKEGFLFIEKEGKVSNSDFVMGKDNSLLRKLPIIGSWFGSTYKNIEVQKDDYARGVLDPFSGRLELETRYYKTQGSQYEFGWSLTAECKNSQRVF